MSGSEDVKATSSGDGGSLTDVERLLMEQYGLESELQSNTGAVSLQGSHSDSLPSRSEAQQDATSLDAHNFSVDAWMNSRKHLSLEMLLHQQKALRTDIKKFKANTQALVHDNYSRFIAAADIIHTMRGEFETLVNDTDELTGKTKAATIQSEGMNSELQVFESQLTAKSCLLPATLPCISTRLAGTDLVIWNLLYNLQS
jgi:hypothetical protein